MKNTDITDNIIVNENTEENTNYELDVSIQDQPNNEQTTTTIQLTNIKDYKLKDLQQLAENNGLTIKKEGAQGKRKIKQNKNYMMN